ncbi:MAG TPA: hypothetical protein VMU39_05610 [Solirubrobacteraceae bacterium]|nr:hypothetical protein [Solirubrobacteraceae bacterium]
MHLLPDAPGTRSGMQTQPGADAGQPTIDRRSTASAGLVGRLGAALAALRWPLTIYAATRVLYLLIALIDTVWHQTPLAAEASNWDGAWYIALTVLGYPGHALHIQSTLGFLPLYPLTIWVVGQVLSSSYAFAGLVISLVGGAVATVLIQRLATLWWGDQAGRRAVLFFCLFPGSIVFSMVYSEGLLLPLIAGCLIALERKRWLLAGCLAGVATAVGPTALPIIPACAVAAGLELRRAGWHDREARKALLAPALAPAGLVAFALFLWFWTGTPFASYIAQHHGWSERTTLAAIPHIASHLGHEIARFHTFRHPGINLNYVSGVIGTVFLLWAWSLIVRVKPRISAAAITWTLFLTFEIFTSSMVPPNPRMLITAFPALMVVAYHLRGKAFNRLLGVSTVLLVAMSLVTYVGTALRP